MNATIVDLRYNMKHVLRAIDRGETVTVLYRGKERAKLTPIAPASGGDAPKTRDQPFFGLWKDREDMSDPASYLRRLRSPRLAAAETGIGNQRRSRKSK
jgi:antitoxin (DNA-binding transcriptional repressor) of toxin-antitoxin stability system